MSGAAGRGRRGVAALLVAEVASLTGSQLSTVALPWFVLTTTGSVVRMSWVMAAYFVPVALFGIVAGGWAGRVGARRWMILSDLCRFVLTAAVPTLYALGALSFPLLLLLTFLTGAFWAPYMASQQTVLAGVTGEDEHALARTGSLLQGATRTAVVLGPPGGAALVVLLGAPAVLLIDAASFLVAAALVGWAVSDQGRPPEEDSPMRSKVGEAMGVLRRDRLLFFWSVGTMITESAGQALLAAFPVLVKLQFRAGVGMVGALLACFGAGALVGSLLAPLVLRRTTAVRLATSAKVLQVVALIPLAFALPPWGFGVVLVVWGVFVGLTNGPASAVRLLRIPVRLRTEAMAVITTVTLLGGSAGLLLVGVAFEQLGTRVPLVIMLAVQAVGAALFLIGTVRFGGRPKPDAAVPTEGQRSPESPPRTEPLHP
ncbi:MFS transporter [Streptomyces caniferus]|uniref:MFS transporter n=1 Tax=Streptomyces caniferus TaxID=285557 RepID=A0A640SAE8_9ACTN|nr:MFS transporter [Streptomyces caniferus]GFE08219.1 MFS transporter [Streptomyces caniferus]